MTDKTKTAHHNSFGALRLLLACAVIVSHSPEMLDGNPSREPLMALGLHVTFGGLAVYGFFIISGYLIASSYLSTRSVLKFMTSRVLRIYPAFLIACLICIFVVAPIADGAIDTLSARNWMQIFAKTISLISPTIPGAFHTLPIPALDGSMWTIRYEFRCYLLVALLGGLGILDKRTAIAGLTMVLYAIVIIISFTGFPTIPRGHLHQFLFGAIGDPSWVFQLTAIFMSGVSARLYRDRLRFKPTVLLLSLVVFCTAATMKSPIPELTVGTAGAYLLLWTALGVKSQFLQSINNRYDFSYGTYLYAWPIASLIMLLAQKVHITLAPLVLTSITSVLAISAGCLSWYLVERPILEFKFRRPVAIRTATP